MKAVIRAEVDPRGVVSGVNEVNRQLGKINKAATTSALATSFTAIGQAFNMARQVLDAIDRRQMAIQDMARKFSPEARGAEMMTEQAKIQQSLALGKMMGPELAQIEQMKQANIAAETARILQSGAGQSAAYEDLKAFRDEMIDRTLEIPGRIVGGGPVANPNMNPAKRFWNPFGDDFLSGQSLAGGRGSARGMPYEDAAARTARAVESMAKGN
jgi:hypothetical protein